MDELKDAKAKAGSSVDRSPNLTGDTESLGAPPQACTDNCHSGHPGSARHCKISGHLL